MTKEHQIEENLIEQLRGLKYTDRPDIVDRKTLEQNFKAKFEALNRVRLSDSEFLRLTEEIIEPDCKEFGRDLAYKIYEPNDSGLIQDTLHELKNFLINFATELDLSLIDEYTLELIREEIDNYCS